MQAATESSDRDVDPADAAQPIPPPGPCRGLGARGPFDRGTVMPANRPSGDVASRGVGSVCCSNPPEANISHST
jgi:hypothetical protein